MGPGCQRESARGFTGRESGISIRNAQTILTSRTHLVKVHVEEPCHSAARDEIELPPAAIYKQRGVARREDRLFLPDCWNSLVVHPLPGFSAIVSVENRKVAANLITNQQPEIGLSELNSIPKPLLVRIREYEIPSPATVRSSIKARLITRSRRHHDCCACIEALNATEVKIMSARRDGAALPCFTVVKRAHDGAVSTARPGHTFAETVNSAKISGRMRILDRPLRLQCTRAKRGDDCNKTLHGAKFI